MFDFVRKHTKVMQFVLFLLVFPSFVLFGLEGYNRYKEKGEPVARVDGHDILQGDWDTAHKADIERFRQSAPNVDPKMFDTPEARYSTLERLVRDRVLSAASVQSKLVTSDAQLARELQGNQMIASLRGPDGKLDMARYKQLVGSQGMTPEMFEQNVRLDLSTRQVLAGVGGTALASPAIASTSLNAFLEKREVQTAMFATPVYAAKVTPTDAELEDYYKQHGAQFQAQEEASVQYVVLDLDTVMKGITVPEAELKTYYEQNAQRLAGQEERRASHILIAVPKTATPAERAKAKAKAEQLLAVVKKAPDSFAEVAKKNSQDPGSAANGGDLDFFARKAMAKPFEDAAFSLKKGEISDVVETEFGYHILRVTDIKLPKQRTFEEMKPELETELKKQQAQRKFAETADTFSNGVYEQADSLKPVADKLKLEPPAGARGQGSAGQPESPRRAVRPRRRRQEAQHRSDRDRPQPAGLGTDRQVHAGANPAVRRSQGQGARAVHGGPWRRTGEEGWHGEAGGVEGQPGRRRVATGDHAVARRRPEAASGPGGSGLARRPDDTAGLCRRRPGPARLCGGASQQGAAARAGESGGRQAGAAAVCPRVGRSREPRVLQPAQGPVQDADQGAQARGPG
jgi:peptidyl-prolyl cis-trans isomerase D